MFNMSTCDCALFKYGIIRKVCNLCTFVSIDFLAQVN